MGPVFCYRLNQLIAVGSFAEVWQAHQVNADGEPCAADVALKIGRCHFDDETSQREYQMLFYSAQQLDGFIQVLDVTRYHDKLVVAWELAEDNLLGIARNGLSDVECVRYIGEVAAALDSLHARDFRGRRLFHAGVNPTDILIHDGHAKLADLSPYPIGPPTNIPFYKVVCMAPELRSQPLPKLLPQSDQYALAATYAWVRLPNGAFAMPRRGELLGAIEIARLPHPEKQVLSKAFSVQPEDRFPSCCAFADALKEAIQG